MRERKGKVKATRVNVKNHAIQHMAALCSNGGQKAHIQETCATTLKQVEQLNFRRLHENDTPSKTLFFDAIRRFSIPYVADKISLHQNTLKRWIARDEVPNEYHDDIARLLNRNERIDGVDQFYTKPEVAERCWKSLVRIFTQLGINSSKYQFIEPSAGCGWFYNLMPSGRRIGIDIQPQEKDNYGLELLQQDFLTWTPSTKGKYAVIGNPPFGLRGHLALQFINHAATFADIVAFILPQLFESDGKGVPAKRVKGLTLAHTEKLPAASFERPDGTPMSIHTIFQVWTKIKLDRIKLKPRPTCKKFIRIYSLSDGGLPANTRNKKMLYECDVYLPSTCFSKMRAYSNFEELPHRRGYGVVIHKQKGKVRKLLMNHDWENTAFASTNSALNLRSSIIEQVVVDGGFKDE